MRRSGWLVVKIILCSVNGWPDVLALRAGEYILLELKSPTKPLKPLQTYVHRLIKKHGGKVYKIDSWEAYEKLNIKNLQRGLDSDL